MKKTAWLLVDAGKTGTLAQCVGLANALDLEFTHFPLKARSFWRFLPPRFWPFKNKAVSGFPDLTSLPDVVISGGRQSAAPAAFLKKKSPSLKTIHILNPYGLEDFFDYVIRPDHDQKKGPHTLTTLGGLHLLTSPLLEEEGSKFKDFFEKFPPPWIGVFVGGKSKNYPFSKKEHCQLVEDLKIFSEKTGASLFVTLSRRSPPDLLPLLKNALKERPSFVWNGIGNNPYYGFLALCEGFIITEESVSMISEAAFTGKPIYTYPLQGGSNKFKRFHQSFQEKGILSPFSFTLPSKTYSPLSELERISKEILL